MNKKLPLQLSAEDVEKNPNFGKLLEMCTEKLNHDGSSNAKQAEYTAAEVECHQAKIKYISNKIILNMIHDILLNDKVTTIPKYCLIYYK